RYNWELDIPIPPGETIREILDDRGITQADFAVRLGKSEKFVSQLVNGKASLTHGTAIELERVLGVPSSFWNAAEAQYRDTLARREQDEELAGQAEWAGSFPLKEMAERGWIAQEAGPGDVLGFFGVSSVEAYGEYWSSPRRLAARMSTAYTASTPAIAAWLRAGEIAAEAVATDPYNEAAFRRVLKDLRPTSRLPVEQWQGALCEACAAVGVAVVFIPDLPKTRCHAVSWWATRSRAVIVLGLRYKTDDQVWFSFYHEAGHLLLDDRRHAQLCAPDADPAAETRADRFAADLLIPPDDYAAFRAAGRPTKATVQAFAESIGIAPGIVVGRLQRDGVIPHKQMNDLKVTLRWAPEPEVYTPEETAEFMLNNAVTAAEYDEVLAEIRAKGIDPNTLVHQPRPES
ncbi:MAG: helix-turn-helix domain-containing protein, partial [Actinomycetota bacterium]|nr:helix-turn-helix domain-containing protein [Actinomycetota bacterium]